jgi:protein-S-isoprenylcysteine O-methyltransferase Ste14
MSVAFWLIVVNLFSFVFSILLLKQPGLKRAFDRLPLLLQKSLVLFNVGPVLALPFVSQTRLDWQWTYLIVGAILTAGAAVFWVLAMRQIGAIPSLKAKERVISSSVYSIVRHPIYLGTVMAAFGLALIAGGIVALLYAPLVLVSYSLLIGVEENNLIVEYGEEYRSYQKKVTHRLIPLLY